MTGDRVDDAQEWLSSVIARGEGWRESVAAFGRDDIRELTVGLTAVPESVRWAREFARTTLGGWSLAAMYDDVRLVVSELVTNAIRHGHGLSTETVGPPIRLSLLCDEKLLTCAVTDLSDRIPVRKEADFVSQTGRGLHLVEAFSDSWSWAPMRGPGKVVWARFLVRR